MAKKDCPVGKKWDQLLSLCMNSMETRAEPEPPTTEPPPAVVVQQIATAPTAHVDPVMVLSLSLWIFVVLATLGSILALALWFIIYRRPTRVSSTSEDAEQQQEPLQKTEPPVIIHPLPSETNGHAEVSQRAAGAPSPCRHFQQGCQTGSKWEEGFNAYRGPAKHAGTEGGGELHLMREHRVPLPATELGGTALVTTKTM